MKSTKRKSPFPPMGETEICRIVKLQNSNPGMPVSRLREIYRNAFGCPPAEASIKKILHSCGIQRTALQSADSAGAICPDAKVNAPNDVWTVEFKSGWLNLSGMPGPIIIRDEFTRFVIAARMLPDSTGATMHLFFDEIFRSNGLPKAIFCSKSTPFGSSASLHGLTKISAWWLALGVSLDWKRPDHTRECRWIERPRMELGFAWRLQNLQEHQDELDRWREELNGSSLPHLKNASPSKLYHGKSSPAPAPVLQLNYPGLEPRRVGKQGYFHFKAHSCFLSTALAGWDIALAPRDDSCLDVRFARVTLGILNPETINFIPAFN